MTSAIAQMDVQFQHVEHFSEAWRKNFKRVEVKREYLWNTGREGVRHERESYISMMFPDM